MSPNDVEPSELSSAPAVESSAKPTHLRYLVLFTACSAAVVIYIHRVGFAQALPELKLSGQDSSRMTAIFLVAYGLFEVPWGYFGDRLGSRHLLTVLVLGWSLMTGMVAVAPLAPAALVFPLLLLCRFTFGAFQAGAFPVISRILADWMATSERASAQGCIWMSTRVGGAAAPILIAWLITTCGNWQTPLWIIAGLGLVWCLAFWPWFRNRPEEMASVNPAELQRIVAGRAPRPVAHGGLPWRQILTSRSACCLCLMYGCCGFASNFYVTLLPTYLQNERGLQQEEGSRLTSSSFAVGMVACLLGGVLSDKIIHWTGHRAWGRRICGLIGLGLGTLGWLAINYTHEAATLGIVLCFIFFCNDLSMGPAWAAAADIGERYAGTLGGTMNMISACLGALGNLVAGYFFFHHQPNLVFIIYAAVYGVGALCWLGIDITQPIAQD